MRMNLLRVGLWSLFTVVAVLCTSVSVQADSPLSPWPNKEVHLLSSSEEPSDAIYDNVTTCNGGKLGSVRLKQDPKTTYSACVFGELGEVRVARFYHPQWFTTYAISFKSDTEFYRIEGICGGMSGCSYAPKTDTFLMQTFVGSWQKIAGIHRDFTDKLQRNVDSMNNIISYNFLQENQPLYFEAGTMPLSIESAAFSQNGEWIALEVRSMGIIRAHVKTLDVRRIVAPGSDYGLGSDPLVQLAVSNDGSSIAIMGRRKGLEVIGIDSLCGDRLTAQTGRYFSSNVVACPPALIDYYSMFRAFYFAGYPSFSHDGKRLSLMATSLYGNNTKAVLSPETNTLKGTYSYVGLGDSFSSGEGETSNAEYLPYTDAPPHGCHVSKRSYPLLVSNLWSVNGISVACSGATTADIHGSGSYKGQGGRLVGLNEAQQKVLQADAITSIRQGIIHQAEFVEKYQPDVVTLGIGGNDAGFIDKLKSCLGVGTCEWAKDPARRIAAGREIQAVFSKIQETVKKIKEVSPESKIILVGYPEIINPTAQCGGVVGLMLNQEERLFMREAIQLLNIVIADVATFEGEYFADVQDVYGNNALCDEAPTAINGVRTGDDMAPISALPKVKVIGAESFHPTPYGHTLVARRLADQFPDAPYMPQCQCSYGMTQSDLTSYWVNESVADSEVRKLIRQDTIASVYRAADTVSIYVPAGIFEPNSPVRIEVHSEPTLLKEITVDAEGVLSTEVELPENTLDGYHTLHILGIDKSLQAVDVYQLITVTDEPATTPGLEGGGQPVNPTLPLVNTNPTVPIPNSGSTEGSSTQAQTSPTSGGSGVSEGLALVGPNTNVSTGSDVANADDALFTLGAVSAKKSQNSVLGPLMVAASIAFALLIGWLLWMKFIRSKQQK